MGINPFHATSHFYTPRIFSDVFRGSRMRSIAWNELTLQWRRSLSYRNQSIDLQSKSMDWFLYDRDLHHERVKWVSLYLSVTKHWKVNWNNHRLRFFRSRNTFWESGYEWVMGSTLNFFLTNQINKANLIKLMYFFFPLEIIIKNLWFSIDFRGKRS